MTGTVHNKRISSETSPHVGPLASGDTQGLTWAKLQDLHQLLVYDLRDFTP